MLFFPNVTYSLTIKYLNIKNSRNSKRRKKKKKKKNKTGECK